MGEIVINSEDHKLYIIEKVEDGEYKARELTEEDIAKLPNAEQQLIRSLQLQAQAMRELAKIQAQAAEEMAKIKEMVKYDRALSLEAKEWAKLGWGYKPKLYSSARTPHRAKLYWHRTRSFCVRNGYH